jgi:hypothetical protein
MEVADIMERQRTNHNFELTVGEVDVYGATLEPLSRIDSWGTPITFSVLFAFFATDATRGPAL